MVASKPESNGAGASRASAAASESRGSSAHAAPGLPQSLEQLAKHLAELKAYGTHYLVAQADRVTQKVRSVLVTVALLLAVALAAIAGLMTAVVLLLSGIAHGLAEVFGGRLWAGQLTTGAGVLGIVAVVMALGLRRWRASSARLLTQKYAERHRRQQSQFGRSVLERAGRK